MIATILRQAPADSRASIAAWRQLSDILAQRGNQLGDDDIRRSLHALAVLRPRIPETVRRDCARAIARHGRFAPLVALYASDVPAVSAIMLRSARLSEADWLAMLPVTSAMARSVLAGRTDLPGGVYRALASLGSASVALPQPVAAVDDAAVVPLHAAPDAAVENGTSQISELVRRIDKYQSTRGQPATDRKPRAPRTAFLFETGADGVIKWADGVTRGTVIGLSIAEAAFGGEPGTDGVAAGGFRQRAEIVNARMMLEECRPKRGNGGFRRCRGSTRRPDSFAAIAAAPVAPTAAKRLMADRQQRIRAIRSAS